MTSLSDWLTECLTIVLLVSILLLRWFLRQSGDDELWGIRWCLDWWIVGTVLVGLSDVLNLTGLVPDGWYSDWRRVLYRGCMTIGAWGWLWQFLQVRRRT